MVDMSGDLRAERLVCTYFLLSEAPEWLIEEVDYWEGQKYFLDVKN